ncbi:3-hydroxyacyl-CoA dehydrogenase NAD-binding domain-containing protein, partial [Francisella tularensis subsp. holarctica]|uniref:3-hydroxyacyl-CoA dehydrogenase NAD-binding domain-containing protein n=1 Tax=Francisella tularensis TaxID=263 RepID=UPI002381B3F3
PAGESDNDSPSSTIASKLEHVESKSQRKAIDKIAVLGDGTMGAQIAAHFANAKFPVVLFDLKSQQCSANVIIEDYLAKLTKLNPAP